MTDTERYQAMARDNLLLHFSKPQVDNLLVLERAEGPYVFDTSGNRYIDALSSLFCARSDTPTAPRWPRPRPAS